MLGFGQLVKQLAKPSAIDPMCAEHESKSAVLTYLDQNELTSLAASPAMRKVCDQVSLLYSKCECAGTDH
jgi:hypothetical protein